MAWALFKDEFWYWVFRDAELSLIHFCAQASHNANSSLYQDVYVIGYQRKGKLISSQETVILNLLKNRPVYIKYFYHKPNNVIYKILFEDPYSPSPERRIPLYFHLKSDLGQWKVIRIYDYDISNEVQKLAS